MRHFGTQLLESGNVRKVTAGVVNTSASVRKCFPSKRNVSRASNRWFVSIRLAFVEKCWFTQFSAETCSTSRQTLGTAVEVFTTPWKTFPNNFFGIIFRSSSQRSESNSNFIWWASLISKDLDGAVTVLGSFWKCQKSNVRKISDRYGISKNISTLKKHYSDP